jgi:septal ring factor EnvC (AmiA/AmiB activator)
VIPEDPFTATVPGRGRKRVPLIRSVMQASSSNRRKSRMGMIRSQCVGLCSVASLAALFIVLAGGAGVQAGTTGSADRQELQRIKKEMREKKQKLKRADKQERSILSDLDAIDRDVQAGKTALESQQKKLHAAEVSLREVEKSNEVVHRELAGLKEAYARRVRALYKMSRNGSAVGLLEPAGSMDAVRRSRYLVVIAERDRRLIEDYGNALERLAGQQAEIAKNREVFLERHRAIEAEKHTLEVRKRKKAFLLASVRKEKGLYEQTLRELEESSASLWAMIRKAERERQSAKRESAHSVPQGSQRDGSARFSWPVEGQVLTKFGMQQHPQFKTMVFRRGIEISAREGEPVHAVSDGRVAFANWYKGYGNLVIIEHGPGFYTLYGNLSRLDLTENDRVSKGQVIGLAGDTGSLKGSKLYFEVRRNGEAQDPLQWLAKR